MREMCAVAPDDPHTPRTYNVKTMAQWSMRKESSPMRPARKVWNCSKEHERNAKET